MTEITIQIPDSMYKIIEDIDEPIYEEAIKSVVKKKLTKKKIQLNRLKRKLARYELKYSKSYEDYENGVPDSISGHEDWIDWTYLHHAVKELNNTIGKIKILLKN
ncbi:hypothetical protein ACFLSX_05560 [Calditrichota bacterium]